MFDDEDVNLLDRATVRLVYTCPDSEVETEAASMPYARYALSEPARLKLPRFYAEGTTIEIRNCAACGGSHRTV